MSKKFYNLKEELFFQDGNTVNEEVSLKILEEDKDGYVKMETVEEHNVKRIFWCKKEMITLKKNEVRKKN
jgi:hypothetical protein